MITDGLQPHDVWGRWLETYVKGIKDTSGGVILGHCPSPDHPDRRPSFSASRDGYWYVCHSCGIKGNPIKFARMFNLDFSVFRGFDFKTANYTTAPSFATSKTGSNPQIIAGNSKNISARVSTK